MKHRLLSIATLAAGTLAANAAVTLVHEYHLGEAGSLAATNNTPLDSAGSADFTNQINGANAVVASSGVFAPGSTAYIDTSSANNTGWYGANFAAVPTDNFAIGVFARAASNEVGDRGDIFAAGGASGGGAGSFKLSLANNGWGASSNGDSWIGGTNGVGGSFTANQWVHLALVRQSGTTTFYINGAAQGGTYGGTPTNSAAHISVSPGGASFFDGHIDEARLVTFSASDSTTDILNTLQAVPEPSSTALLGLGAMALIFRRKLR